MAALAERYAAATRAKNLTAREYGGGPLDVLAAIALTHKMASPLYRASVANDATSVRELHRMWAEECYLMANSRRWSLRANMVVGGNRFEVDGLAPRALVKLVASQSLDFWLNDVCPTCTGRRYLTVGEEGTPSAVGGALSSGRDALSDVVCPTCGGSGKRPLVVTPPELRPLVIKALSSLGDRFAQYGRDAVARLK